jgi:hypothetical protein
MLLTLISADAIIGLKTMPIDEKAPKAIGIPIRL